MVVILIAGAEVAAAMKAVATMLDGGSNITLLISCALVNFMTPGLAFFYGGLVRRNHVLCNSSV